MTVIVRKKESSERVSEREREGQTDRETDRKRRGGGGSTSWVPHSVPREESDFSAPKTKQAAQGYSKTPILSCEDFIKYEEENKRVSGRLCQ